MTRPDAGWRQPYGEPAGLLAGEYLLLEEVLGRPPALRPTPIRATGRSSASRSSKRRRSCVPRPLDGRAVDPGRRRRPAASAASCPLARKDATTHALLPVPRRRRAASSSAVTIVRANVTPADHGRTVIRELLTSPLPVGTLPPVEPGAVACRSMSSRSSTAADVSDDARDPRFAPDGRLATGGTISTARRTRPCRPSTVEYGWEGVDSELFRPQRTLIGSDMFDAHFVAEIGNRGAAVAVRRRPVWPSHR